MKTIGFKKLHRRLKKISLPAISLACFLSCSYDHGVDPVRTRISGEVVFTGVPPKYVREAVFIAAKKLPPDNFLTDIVFSDPLVFDTSSTRTTPDTVKFNLIADAGKYTAAGVLWRRSGEPWDIANILGIYTEPEQIIPKEIELNAEHPVEEGVSIPANWALANRDSYIEGTITFADEWPANTEIVALTYFSQIPRNVFEYIIYLKGLDINVKKFAPSHRYRSAVNSGEYKFIALFWYAKGASLNDIRAVGFYHCPSDSESSIPRKVLAPRDGEVKNIDFTVRFSTLPNGVNFCKNCGDCK